MTELDHLRAELDAIDARILTAIAARFDVIRRIAGHKQAHGVPMMQQQRVSFVRDRYHAFGAANGLQADTFARIAGELIEAACRLEDQLMLADPVEIAAYTQESQA